MSQADIVLNQPVLQPVNLSCTGSIRIQVSLRVILFLVSIQWVQGRGRENSIKRQKRPIAAFDLMLRAFSIHKNETKIKGTR